MFNVLLNVLTGGELVMAGGKVENVQEIPSNVTRLPQPKRDTEFARRLQSACDGNANVPPLHQGRLTYLQKEMESRFNENVSVETVRKWMSGETIPRAGRASMLAQILEVDAVWLEVGGGLSVSPRERKVRNAMADGAVNVIAGLIQMDGGHPAFPEASDARATQENVDIYAIIRGANYAFHVTLASEERGELSFVVPVNHERVVVLGVVKDGFSFKVYEVPNEVIGRGVRHGAAYQVSVAGSMGDLIEVESFAQRI